MLLIRIGLWGSWSALNLKADLHLEGHITADPDPDPDLSKHEKSFIFHFFSLNFDL
jgi:hypothetical protein